MNRHTIGSSNTSWGNSSIIDRYKEQITFDANGNIKTFKRNGDKTGSLAPMDDLTYGYTVDNNGRLVNNKLRHVKDAVNNGYSTDIDNQANDNYTYDKIGNLIADDAASIQKIDWTVYGKISTIKETNKSIAYDYDAGGNRINKKVADNTGSTTTHYVRDAQGNVMGVYSYKGNTAGTTLTQGSWNEQHLYGSSRIGMLTPNVVITTPLASANYNGTNDHTEDEGKRLYELSNHLGNVMVTSSILISGFLAKILFSSIYET